MMEKKLNILLIEDNQVHIMLIKQSFNELGKYDYNFTVIDNGYRAKQFFNTVMDNPKAILPDLIFLDLDLPKVNGIEVLRFIKKKPLLRHIPVLILSGSAEHSEMMKCYKYYCSSYLQKPINADGFKDLVVAIEKFWFGVALLPTILTTEEIEN